MEPTGIAMETPMVRVMSNSRKLTSITAQTAFSLKLALAKKSTHDKQRN